MNVAALLRTGDEPRMSIEFRALSMAVISSGPIEWDRRARSNSLMGIDVTRGVMRCSEGTVLAAGGTYFCKRGSN